MGSKSSEKPDPQLSGLEFNLRDNGFELDHVSGELARKRKKINKDKFQLKTMMIKNALFSSINILILKKKSFYSS